MSKTLYEIRCIWNAALQLLQFTMTAYPRSESLKKFYEKKRADVITINEMLKGYADYTPDHVILEHFREEKVKYKFFGMIKRPRSYFSITKKLQTDLDAGL